MARSARRAGLKQSVGQEEIFSNLRNIVSGDAALYEKAKLLLSIGGRGNLESALVILQDLLAGPYRY